MDVTLNPCVWGGKLKLIPPSETFKWYRLTIEENDSNHGVTNFVVVHLTQVQVESLRDSAIQAIAKHEEIPELEPLVLTGTTAAP